jgi:hypothetical protein
MGANPQKSFVERYVRLVLQILEPYLGKSFYGGESFSQLLPLCHSDMDTNIVRTQLIHFIQIMRSESQNEPLAQPNNCVGEVRWYSQIFGRVG